MSQENFYKSKFDKLLIAFSVIYVILPVIIFFSGWLNYYFSVPAVVIMLYFAYSIYNELSSQNVFIMGKGSYKFWLLTFCRF